jgi:SPP1 family predicted phage head-tail adaptor
MSRTWTAIATVRAELVQLTAEEYLTGFGEGDASGAVFRIRYLSGITTADRVNFDGTVYDIDKMSELGRKRGLELRCSVVVA